MVFIFTSFNLLLSPSCLLNLIYLFQELLRQQLLLAIAWDSFILHNQSLLSLYQSMFSAFSISSPSSPYYLSDSLLSNLASFVGTWVYFWELICLKASLAEDIMDWGTTTAEESLVGATSEDSQESSVLKAEHFYYEKKYHPRIVK